MHQQLRSLYPSSHTWRLPSWTAWTSFGIRPHSQLASTPSTRFVCRQPRNMLYSSFQSLLPIQLPSKHNGATFWSLNRGGKTGPTNWAGLFSPLLLAGLVEVLNSSPLLGLRPTPLNSLKKRSGLARQYILQWSDTIYFTTICLISLFLPQVYLLPIYFFK